MPPRTVLLRNRASLAVLATLLVLSVGAVARPPRSETMQRSPQGPWGNALRETSPSLLLPGASSVPLRPLGVGPGYVYGQIRDTTGALIATTTVSIPGLLVTNQAGMY